jgi:hypothetical protein
MLRRRQNRALSILGHAGPAQRVMQLTVGAAAAQILSAGMSSF